MKTDADVLIVGAGIGGAVLAALLSRKGLKVIVLEREAAAVVRQRPEVLWPETIRRITPLLPSGEEASWGQKVNEIAAYEESKLLFSSGSSFAEVVPISTNPNRTRELLVQAAGAEIRRGIEVLSLIKQGEKIIGVLVREVVSGKELKFYSDIIVGDDGARSKLRDDLGIKIKINKFPIQALTFSFAWPNTIPKGSVRAWINSQRKTSGVLASVAIPWPAGKGILLTMVRPDALIKGVNGFYQQLNLFAEKNSDMKEVVSSCQKPDALHPLQLAWGHAENYGKDLVVLIGDAVHPVTPVGGQGANMAIADAFALSELIINRDCKDLAAGLQKMRRAANERSVSISRRASTVLSIPVLGMMSALLPLFLRLLNWRKKLFLRGLRFISTAFSG